MNFILHIDEPDIILVENLDDLNTSCIIFNVSGAKESLLISIDIHIHSAGQSSPELS